MRRIPQGAVRKMIRDCGQTVSFSTDPPLSCRAVIQPLRYKNKMYLDGDHLTVGEVDTGHYRYIGPRDVRLDRMPAGTVLKTEEQEYVIKRAEVVRIGNRIVYNWAVLQPHIEEEW